MAILEAVRKKDWERLGVLLGVYDSELGKVLATWSSLPRHIRIAVGTLIASRPPDRPDEDDDEMPHPT